MFRIRPEQMEALASASKRPFEERLADFLRQEFTDAAAMDAEEFEAGVKAQVEKAKIYGLEEEPHAATYVTTAWMLGENFDQEFPAAQRKLPSRVISPQQKSDWLARWTEMLFVALEED